MLIIGIIIIALADFTDALEKICNLFIPTNIPSVADAKWQPPDLGNDQNSLGTLECGQMPPWGFTAGEPALGIESDVSTNGKPTYYLGLMPGSTNQIPIGVSLINNRFYIVASVPIDGTNLMTTHGIFVTKIYGAAAYPDDLPWKWDLNYSSNALEFVDEDYNPMFQVIYLRPNRIAVKGYFAVGDRYLILGEKIVFFGRLPIDKTKSDLKPLFKYPSALHKGEYAK